MHSLSPLQDVPTGQQNRWEKLLQEYSKMKRQQRETDTQPKKNKRPKLKITGF
jgi:hypothetical protein